MLNVCWGAPGGAWRPAYTLLLLRCCRLGLLSSGRADGHGECTPFSQSGGKKECCWGTRRRWNLMGGPNARSLGEGDGSGWKGKIWRSGQEEKMRTKHIIAQMALLAALAELCPWQTSIPAPLMICIGVGVMPGLRFSSFAICSFKNQETAEKNMEENYLNSKLQYCRV